MLKKYTFLHILMLCTLPLLAQVSVTNNAKIPVDWDVCRYFPKAESHKSYVPVSSAVLERMTSRGTNCSTFIVNYNGFTPQAQTAFQFAVDIWANALDSNVPIRVDATFGPLGPGVLGGAGPTNFIPLTIPGVAANTAYPIALAEKLTGSEIPDGPSPTSVDINATFSSTANFYFGTDGNTPAGQVDFVSVVLHELGHGLGVIGFAREDSSVSPSQGAIRQSGFTSIWDNFIENGTPNAITSFADPSVALLNELTSSNLFCNSPIATGQNSGVKPSTFAPATFIQGSSYSHWDEATYPAGDPNSLMTPSIAPGEAIHDPGALMLAFMEDMGWSLCGGTLNTREFEIASIEVNPNPFTSSFTIKIPNNINDSFTIEILDLNGRVIHQKSATATSGNITITNLDDLANALYFVKISNNTTGSSITKKLLKQ